MSDKEKKGFLFYLSIVGPVASALKTFIEVVIELLKGTKR